MIKILLINLSVTNKEKVYNIVCITIQNMHKRKRRVESMIKFH